ncbi:MAG TPA: glycosyltransferase family 2 protein, partial [Propionibacteriaceae bacterium]
MPVLNEERHLEAAVCRVLDQEYPGELEVIIAAGPSSDRTREIADALAATDPRIRVVDNPAARTPTALNLGIAASKHTIIVRVDGHGELTDGYIRRGVELLEETGAANVGGVMDAQGTTPFEEAVATAYTTRLGLGGGAFHLADSPAAEAETVFLGVFRKDALVAVGGFDETMHRAQDWELNYRLRTSGHKIWF